MKKACPACCKGHLLKRNGPYGEFIGCSNFPECHYTEKMKKSSDATSCAWVNASSIGSTKYCPQFYYLTKQARALNKTIKSSMQQGIAAHQKISHDGRCYLATHVFGEADWRVHFLRKWRNEKLLSSKIGRACVRLYYCLSPLMIKFFGKYRYFHQILRFLITKLVNRLNS